MTETTTTNEVQIKENEAVALILSLVNKGTRAVTVLYRADARLRKTGNPFSMPVMKTSGLNGMVGYDYERSVTAQRKREGNGSEFQAEQRKWGVRLNRGIVFHNNQLYVTVKSERAIGECKYFDAMGNELTHDEVKPFLPKKSRPKTQGTEKEIMHREIRLDNITEIHAEGKIYKLI